VRTGLVGNNDEELGKEVLYSRIYGPTHPYGSPNLGHSSDIANLTLDDVKQFYADFYTINNIKIGLSGGYPESFAKQLSSDLQSLPEGRRASIEVPAATMSTGSSAVIVEKETPAVAVSFGFPIDLKRGDSDWIALWLARSYLGEHRSAAGQLYKRIRETRGMNYGDYAYIEYFPNGMFTFQPATNLGRQQQIFQVWIRPLRSNNDAHVATRIAVHEIQKLVEEGMTESDFEATKSFLSKFVSLSMDGQSRQLGYQLDSEYYEIDGFADYVRNGLNDLTLADVNRVMRENLKMDDVQYVFVTKDAEDLKSRLVGDVPSKASYDADMSPEILEEDKLLEAVSLSLSESDVTVISSEDVFK
jgi:zinc protease